MGRTDTAERVPQEASVECYKTCRGGHSRLFTKTVNLSLPVRSGSSSRWERQFTTDIHVYVYKVTR